MKYRAIMSVKYGNLFPTAVMEVGKAEGDTEGSIWEAMVI
jgi:hypothetical protein